MTPIVINAKNFKKEEIELMKKEVEEIKEIKNRPPKLTIIKATNDKACECYIRNKIKIGQETGIEVEVLEFPKEVSKNEFETSIRKVGQDPFVDSIIVQEPIYEHLNGINISSLIPSSKDGDGFSIRNLGAMLSNSAVALPCTPIGVINLLKNHCVEIEGSKVTVIGRSVNVGLSLSIILTQLGAVVTTTHSKSKDLEQDIQNADIVISCVGKRNLIKPEWMKKGSILLGVGIIYENGKQYTDYEVEEMVSKSECSLVGDRVNCTGTATVLSLMRNTIKLAKLEV